MALYTLAFHGDGELPLERVRDQDLRLTAAEGIISVVAAVDDEAVIVLPAGFANASSSVQRDGWAAKLRELSREHGVALAFGIDVSGEDAWEVESRPRSFAFACDRGRKLLWTSPVTEEIGSCRLLTIRDHQLLLLQAKEIFAKATRRLAETLQPDVIVAIAHGGPTKKWLPSLIALDEIAPTIVVHDLLPGRKTAWPNLMRGWASTVLVSNRALTIRRHEARTAHGAVESSMGHWGP
jgi:hypothetical protein